MSLGILRIVGIILFVYLTWRNLKNNYEEDKIVNYSWIALLGFFVVGRITYGLVNFGIWNDSWLSWFSVWNKPGMDYIGGFLALILINFIFSKINSWKFIPFCEDGLVNSLFFLVFLIADEFLRSKFDLKTGVYLLFLVLMILLANLAKKKYRSLVWYKSGKKGFAFLITGFFAFLILGFLGLYFKINLPYLILYWLISLISLTGLCILGEVFNFLVINKRR
ncbi:MAG: hypothetical protein PHE32_01420 [Candidatus Shapirobacteria bacterium]|nr:hypothetical protein [Candidatus Shapirobacteria bacterium]MDD4410347.1 hypothetical protein [Candidatus Shapirobacteria bacterium]